MFFIFALGLGPHLKHSDYEGSSHFRWILAFKPPFPLIASENKLLLTSNCESNCVPDGSWVCEDLLLGMLSLIGVRLDIHILR